MFPSRSRLDALNGLGLFRIASETVALALAWPTTFENVAHFARTYPRQDLHLTSHEGACLVRGSVAEEQLQVGGNHIYH